MPTVGIPLLISDDVPKILALFATNPVDSGAVVASDATPTIIILTLISAVDSATVGASDVAQAPSALIPAVDAPPVGLTESINTLFKSTEGIPLHTLDVASVAVVQPATETIVMGLTEIPQIAVTQSVVDSLTIQASDATPAVPVTIRTSDSCTIQASDATPTLNTGGSSIANIAASDSITCGLTDGAPPEFAALVASDSISVTIDFGIFGEETSIFAFTPQQFVQVSVIDSCKVQVLTPPINTTFISASDNCVVQAVEPTDNSHTFSTVDSLRATVSDVASVNTGVASFFTLSTTDSCTVQLGDLPTVVKTVFDVFLATTDSCGITVSDLGTITFNIIFISTTDALVIQASDVAQPPVRLLSTTDAVVIQAVEPTDAMSFPSVSDAPAIQASDAGPQIAGSFSFNVTDALAMQETEGVPAFPLAQTVLTSESITVVPVDSGPLVASAVFASETLQISLNDASLLLLKFLALTDPLAIPIADAATLFNSFIQTVASDSATVQASDVVTFVQQSLTQLATTDALTMGLDDAPTVTQSSVSANDAIVNAAQELVLVLNALYAQDSAAWRVNAENANIINPFVINSAVSVSDVIMSDVTENTLGMPSLLSFIVTDSVAGQVLDLALTEDLPIPGTLDFTIPISFAQVNDPQSYQTVSSKFW